MSLKGNNKGNNTMKNRLQKVTSLTAILLCLSMVTGSLASCGSVSFAVGDREENAGNTASSPVIEVESTVDSPEYYTEDEEIIYDESEITSYSVDAISNDESSGTVESEIGYLEGKQTITATATPAEGHELDHWEMNGDEIEELGDSSQVSVTDITGNVTLEAVFTDPDSGLLQEQRLLSMTPSLRAPAPLRAAPTATPIPTPVIRKEDVPALPTPTDNYQGGAFYRLFTYIAPEIDPAWGRVTGGFIGNTKTPVTINATANSGYEFDRWRIIEAKTHSGTEDGKVYDEVIRDYEKTGTSSLTLNFQAESTDAKTIYVTWCFAYFKPEGAYTVNVVNDPPSGGTSTIQEKNTSGADVGSPVFGQAEITSGNTAVITATPATGYKFECFITSSGTRVSGADNGAGGYTLTIKDVSQDETITAKYKKISNVKNTIQATGKKRDLVNEHFYNEKRIFTEPNYTVTRQTMQNLAAVSVSYDKLRNANDLQALHSYKAVASVRDYFDRKLSASDIILAEGILTTTKGEVIPLERIKDIDALMNSAKSISLDKFGERYDSEIVAAIYTEPPEEFDGLVRTYLWKETGAQKGDNIYVMYRDTGSSYQEMAAVVDDDGTVRFTLEDALIGTEFVLVRVNIESKHLSS